MPVAGKKFFFGIIGVFATLLAFIGFLVPVLPGTPFLILALWAFSKSSLRLKARLETLPLIKTALIEVEQFERDRSVDRRVKMVAMGSAWTSTAIVGSITHSLMITAIVGTAALACTLFMLYVPTRRSSGAVAPSEESKVQL